MSEEAFLLRQQDEIKVTYDEEEDCFVIEQASGYEDSAAKIFISAWNLPDFMQRLEWVFKKHQKAE